MNTDVTYIFFKLRVWHRINCNTKNQTYYLLFSCKVLHVIRRMVRTHLKEKNQTTLNAVLHYHQILNFKICGVFGAKWNAVQRADDLFLQSLAISLQCKTQDQLPCKAAGTEEKRYKSFQTSTKQNENNLLSEASQKCSCLWTVTTSI